MHSDVFFYGIIKDGVIILPKGVAEMLTEEIKFGLIL